MKYKTEYEKQEFIKVTLRLRYCLIGLDFSLQALFGYELTLTSVYRPGDPKFHGCHRAVDFRSWDMPNDVRAYVFQHLAKLRTHSSPPGTGKRQCPQFQHIFEKEVSTTINGKKKIIMGEHFHIELDDGRFTP